MPASAQTYLESVEKALAATGSVAHEGEIVADPSGLDVIGALWVRLAYRSGHNLHVSLTVDTTAGYPDWVHYSVHVVTADRRVVFRYDNAPHHPEL